MRKRVVDALSTIDSAKEGHKKQYINFVKAKTNLNSKTVSDYKKVYNEQLTLLTHSTPSTGMFSKLTGFVTKPFTSERPKVDPHANVRSSAKTFYDKLDKSTNSEHTQRLNSSINSLQRTIGYYPGMNWNVIGTSAIVVGVLALGIAKYTSGPVKLAMTLLGVSALAMSLVAVYYNCYKDQSNDEMAIAISGEKLEISTNNITIAEQIKQIRESSKQDKSEKACISNLKEWTKIYTKYYKEDVDTVLGL